MSRRKREGRTIKLRRLGTDQVVHVPKYFEFEASEVYLWQDGNRLCISPFPPEGPLQPDANAIEPR
jgi:virulence-associated protein VagC